MTVTDNVRELVRSVALGDAAKAQRINDELSDEQRDELGIFGTAVVSVCLGHQFKDDSSHDAIRRFVARMQANYANTQPPLKPFAIEGVIRAFAGEEHLLDEISAQDQLASQFPIIREIVAETPELHGRIDDVLTDAETLVREWTADV